MYRLCCQVSPLAGCVPILLTLPVVWGLYRAFNNASIDGSFGGGPGER